LNTFIRGQKFEGVEKINLNGEHNDPSISRAYISWFIFRSCGIPASRSNHVELYINEEYKGLYLNVEHIDDEFVDKRFGNDDGNLYKCLWPANLDYHGTTPEIYKFENNGRRAYELKRNIEEDDYSDLANFIDILNNTDPEELNDKLNMVFNVNTYLKNMAVEVLVGHWDAYSYNKNNYYLYNNEGTGKFEFIPYDTDNTFGISWSDEDFSSRDIYNWSSSWEPRPLMVNILENDVFRDRYSFYMKKFLEDVYNPDTLNPMIDALRSKIAQSASGDIFRSLDYEYTYNDFYSSFDISTGAHVKKGIKQFVSERSESALDQLIVNPIDPILTLLSARGPGLNVPAEVRFLAEDDGMVDDAKIWFSEGGSYTEGVVENRNDGVFQANFNVSQGSGELRFYIEAMDNEQNKTRDPLEGYYSMDYGIGTGISYESLLERDFMLFPNPAHSVLYSDSFITSSDLSFSIFDLSGRIVQKGRLNETDSGISLDKELINGMYLLKVRISDLEGNNSVFTRKFIIER